MNKELLEKYIKADGNLFIVEAMTDNITHEQLADMFLGWDVERATEMLNSHQDYDFTIFYHSSDITLVKDDLEIFSSGDNLFVEIKDKPSFLDQLGITINFKPDYHYFFKVLDDEIIDACVFPYSSVS